MDPKEDIIHSVTPSKKGIKETLILLVPGILFLLLLTLILHPRPAQNNTKSLNIITIGTKTLNVILADTNEKRTKGLGGVTSLNKNEGMFFIFDQKPTNQVFWMKGMLIPIDIIWIKDNKVAGIEHNLQAPPPGTSDSSLTLYNSPEPVDYVLEVNADWANQNNIKVGDVVKMQFDQ